MSRVGSSRTDAVAVAWSFPAGTWWGAPGTETPSKAHYLSHEALPIGDHKQSYAAELRQVLADSAETPFALTPAAAEELRRIYRAVTESSGRAKERATALHGYIQKLDKYQNDQKLDKSWKDLVWQQRQLALRFHHEWQMNILGTKPADPLAEFVSTGSTPKQQQEGMSRVGSSRTDANAWSFHAGTSWGAPPTEPLDKYQNDLVWQLQRTRLGFHHRMTFQELRRITDGFSEKRLLGKAGADRRGLPEGVAGGGGGQGASAADAGRAQRPLQDSWAKGEVCAVRRREDGCLVACQQQLQEATPLVKYGRFPAPGCC